MLRNCKAICQITPVTNMMMNFTNDNLDCLWRFGSSLLAFGLKTVLSLRKRAEAKELTFPIGAMRKTHPNTITAAPSMLIARTAKGESAVSQCIALLYAAQGTQIGAFMFIIIFITGCWLT